MTSRPSWIFALFLAACGGATVAPEAPRAEPGRAAAELPPEPVPGLRLPADVTPTRYALQLSIDPRQERFSGEATIEVTLSRARRVIYLHGQGLDVRAAEVVVDGEAVPATWAAVDAERGLAALTLERPVGPGQARIHVAYEAAFDRSLEGLYRVEQAGEHYAFTQMEPLAARKAFPCFDEPSFKTPFEVTLTVPEGSSAIANAPERASEAGDGTRRVAFATTEPLPTYLVAFAVGPFDVVDAPPIPASDVRDRPIPLRGVAPRGQGPRLAHALQHTPALLGSLERYFGIAYPYAKLDLIAVPDFAAGAMENAGAITFRDTLLLLGEDAPLRQQRGFAYVTAHELAHQWFGNLVTMAWWDDLWLNEAFATWAETRTVEDVFPQHGPQIAQMGNVLEAMEADSLASARRIRQPIEDDHDIHNAFDSITYSKGDAVLSMFERWLGPDVFRRGVQRYLRARPHGNATADDLFAALSAEAGRDVSAPLSSFVAQEGVPLVEAAPSCQDGRGRVALRQARYAPLGSSASADRAWQIPVCVRYSTGGQLHRECTLLTEAEGAIELAAGCPAWVMPNADGVGYYRFSMPPDALGALRRSGLSSLTARETMAFADSVEASFAAGRTSFADALRALEPLAAAEERSVARAPMALVELAIERVLDERAAQRARAHAARLYAARARRLGWTPRPGETPDTQLLRAEVLSFLAHVARDAGVRREAARRGRAYLGLGGGGAIDPRAVPTDLAELAVTVAVQEGGAEAFDHALGLLASSTDPAVRSRLVAALAAARDPALRRRALELALDARLRTNEIFRPLMAQFGDPEGVDGAWTWLAERYDALAGRMGPGYAGYLPYAATGFCSAERAAEARSFFEPRVAATQGGPRNLTSAIETVELCAARVEHARRTAPAYFAR